MRALAGYAIFFCNAAQPLRIIDKMAFTEQIILVSVGAGIALLSSLISIFVQHRLQLRRTKRSEKIEGEIAAQYSQLREESQKRLNHSGEPVVDVLKISEAVSKELTHKNLDEVPTEKIGRTLFSLSSTYDVLVRMAIAAIYGRGRYC